MPDDTTSQPPARQQRFTRTSPKPDAGTPAPDAPAAAGDGEAAPGVSDADLFPPDDAGQGEPEPAPVPTPAAAPEPAAAPTTDGGFAAADVMKIMAQQSQAFTAAIGNLTAALQPLVAKVEAPAPGQPPIRQPVRNPTPDMAFPDDATATPDAAPKRKLVWIGEYYRGKGEEKQRVTEHVCYLFSPHVTFKPFNEDRDDPRPHAYIDEARGQRLIDEALHTKTWEPQFAWADEVPMSAAERRNYSRRFNRNATA